jgi:DNA-binding NtrC family response regulator
MMQSMRHGEAARRKILVVDDEQQIVDILQEHLSTTYDVTSARDGKRALELVRATHPDLIFLDITMPGINGVDVLKAVKQLDPMIPVIAITGNRDPAMAAEVLKHGAFSYFPKPFDLRYLDHLAASALRG